jgi:hypothetical protein
MRISVSALSSSPVEAERAASTINAGFQRLLLMQLFPRNKAEVWREMISSSGSDPPECAIVGHPSKLKGGADGCSVS